MSRLYGMQVTIRSFAPARESIILKSAEDEWSFENWHRYEGAVFSYAQDSLAGGETDDEFADRLALAIWKANGGFCEVEVAATYLEEVPCECYTRDEDDYERLVTGNGEDFQSVSSSEPPSDQVTRAERDELDRDYWLNIDPGEFVRQRRLLDQLAACVAEEGEVRQLRFAEIFAGDRSRESLLGLINLTDAIADQAHDRHGLPCLLGGNKQ